VSGPGHAGRTVDEAEALARWIELHHRNLTTIYVTHMHIDHYGGLSVLQRHFPDVRAIATPKSVELMPKQPEELDRHQYRRRTD
jgi:glyoxylase-like metal-dependent hydrolase (beta-lactamase superfamily II)